MGSSISHCFVWEGSRITGVPNFQQRKARSRYLIVPRRMFPWTVRKIATEFRFVAVQSTGYHLFSIAVQLSTSRAACHGSGCSILFVKPSGLSMRCQSSQPTKCCCSRTSFVSIDRQWIHRLYGNVQHHAICERHVSASPFALLFDVLWLSHERALLLVRSHMYLEFVQRPPPIPFLVPWTHTLYGLGWHVVAGVTCARACANRDHPSRCPTSSSSSRFAIDTFVGPTLVKMSQGRPYRANL